MGLIRTGIMAGTALYGLNVVSKNLDGRNGDRGRRLGGMLLPSFHQQPQQQAFQAPPHPLCSCPYCPQNQQQHATQGYQNCPPLPAQIQAVPDYYTSRQPPPLRSRGQQDWDYEDRHDGESRGLERLPSYQESKHAASLG